MGKNKERILENVSTLAESELNDFILFCKDNKLHYYYDEVYDKAYGLLPDEEVHDKEIICTIVGILDTLQYWNNKPQELNCI